MMIQVRIFGPLRESLGMGSLTVDASQAGTINELLPVVGKTTSAATLSELRKASIFVNGTNVTSLRLLRTPVKSGDEVVLLSPVGGG
ncbi:MAG: MoaD/ThiS family protein [Firmicutes bacterium]|nr:MoaD/ThiS family protein [Bacillota bacterium]